MAGARIPSFLDVPAVSPARDPGLSVDANDFGYQEGAALSDLGGVVRAEAAELQDRANSTWLMETIAKTRRAMGERSRAAELAAEPGAPNHTTSLLGQIDPLIEAALKSAPSERTRMAAFERLSAMRESVADSASGFEATERAVHSRTKADETANILTAQLLTSPDDLPAVMQEIEATLAVLPPREAEALRPGYRYQAVANYLTARIDQDPVAAREEIASGVHAGDLQGKDAAWLKDADSEIARREAQAKADEAEAARLAKAELADKRASVTASWPDWETEVKVKGVIPQGAEAQIRDAFTDDPEKGESLIAELRSEQEFFPKRKQAGTQSMAEQQATADGMFQDIGGPGAALEADQAARYAQAVTQDRESLAKDPALNVLQNSPELQAAWAAAEEKGDPAATAAAVALSDQLQIAKGLKPWQTRIFSEGAAATEVGAFAFMSAMPGDPTAKALDRQTGALAAAARIDQLAAQYGPNWPRALDELVAAGLPKEAQVLASFSGPGKSALFRADLVTAMDIGEQQLEKAAGSNATKVNDAVNAELAEFMGTFGNSPDAVLPYRNAVYMVALLRAKGTGDPEEAASKAAEALQGMYATVPDNNNGGAGYRIPAPSLNDPEAIQAGTEAAIDALGTMDISPYGSPNPVIQGEAGYVASQYAEAVARDHHWITAPGEGGLLLLGPDYQPVMRGDKPVFFSWDELRDWSDAAQPTTVDGIYVGPTPYGVPLDAPQPGVEGGSGAGKLGGSAAMDDLLAPKVYGMSPDAWAKLKYESQPQAYPGPKQPYSEALQGLSETLGLGRAATKRIVELLDFTPIGAAGAALDASAAGDPWQMTLAAAGIGAPGARLFRGAAVKIGERVFEGTNHALALRKAMDAGFDLPKLEAHFNAGAFDQGFVTSDGRFVDRAEAASMAGSQRPSLTSGEAFGQGVYAKPLEGSSGSGRIGGSAAADDLTNDLLASLGYLKAGPTDIDGRTIAAMRYGKDERGPAPRPGMDPRVLEHLPAVAGYQRDASSPGPGISHETILAGSSYIRDNAPPARPGPKVTLAMPPARPDLGGALGIASDVPGVRPEVSGGKPKMAGLPIPPPKPLPPERIASNGELAAAGAGASRDELTWRKEYQPWLRAASDEAITTMLASVGDRLTAGGMVMPVASGKIRNDEAGSGGFHSRTGGHHEGVDILAEPGEIAFAPMSGEVTKLGYVYAGDMTYRYVEIFDAKTKRNVRLLYVLPGVFKGQKVTAGVTALGAMQDVSKKWGGKMQAHLHMEVREGGAPGSKQGTTVDPWPMLEAGMDVALAMLEAEGQRRGLIQVASR